MNMFSLSRPSLGSRKRPLLGIRQGGGTIFRAWEALIDPAATVAVLLALMVWFGDTQYEHYVVLIVLIFALSFPGKSLLQETTLGGIREVLFSWFLVVGLLGFFGLATGFYELYPIDLLRHWLWMTPLAQFVGHRLFRLSVPSLLAAGGYPKKAVVVGCNDLGSHLVTEMQLHPMQGIQFEGYFDDRALERLNIGDSLLLGRFANVADYTKKNGVEIIYLALPMTTQPRVLSLLDTLYDTTASIYFVPDIFVTDLIQARMDVVGHVPVLAVCDTPFSGTNGFIKRLSDIFLSMFILLLCLPLLLMVALLVKLSSPGPVIFRQRRYGLDGKEITVYKFRSMTVCEDGPSVLQARKGDARLTRIGAFLRAASIDELPQFINVLQGRMSIVGPRPHAVAHNEMYRKLIKGYMLRHKVKPGITGWAQVNGFRGETETLDKMQARIDYDLEYLRNWSLQLDLSVIARTVVLVLKDRSAY